MKQRVLAISILPMVLALVVFLPYVTEIGFGASPPFQTFSNDAEPTLQELLNVNGFNINVTADETSLETFPAGYYKMEILAEFATYAPLNNLSWYGIGNGQATYIFLGENEPGDNAYFDAKESFGLRLGSPDGFFYTEVERNPDGKDHALVFTNPKAAGYVIAWEDLWNLGDADYQDAILATLTPLTVDVYIFPSTLNLKSQGRWITAIVRLPEGYNASDVDVSSLMLNGTIMADRVHRIDVHCGDRDILVVKFSRHAVIELIKGALQESSCRGKSLRISLTITGEFLDGVPFRGTDTIRVIHFGWQDKFRG